MAQDGFNVSLKLSLNDFKKQVQEAGKQIDELDKRADELDINPQNIKDAWDGIINYIEGKFKNLNLALPMTNIADQKNDINAYAHAIIELYTNLAKLDKAVDTKDAYKLAGANAKEVQALMETVQRKKEGSKVIKNQAYKLMEKHPVDELGISGYGNGSGGGSGSNIPSQELGTIANTLNRIDTNVSSINGKIVGNGEGILPNNQQNKTNPFNKFFGKVKNAFGGKKASATNDEIKTQDKETITVKKKPNAEETQKTLIEIDKTIEKPIQSPKKSDTQNSKKIEEQTNAQQRLAEAVNNTNEALERQENILQTVNGQTQNSVENNDQLVETQSAINSEVSKNNEINKPKKELSYNASFDDIKAYLGAPNNKAVENLLMSKKQALAILEKYQEQYNQKASNEDYKGLTDIKDQQKVFGAFTALTNLVEDEDELDNIYAKYEELSEQYGKASQVGLDKNINQQLFEWYSRYNEIKPLFEKIPEPSAFRELFQFDKARETKEFKVSDSNEVDYKAKIEKMQAVLDLMDYYKAILDQAKARGQEINAEDQAFLDTYDENRSTWQTYYDKAQRGLNNINAEKERKAREDAEAKARLKEIERKNKEKKAQEEAQRKQAEKEQRQIDIKEDLALEDSIYGADEFNIDDGNLEELKQIVDQKVAALQKSNNFMKTNKGVLERLKKENEELTTEEIKWLEDLDARKEKRSNELAKWRKKQTDLQSKIDAKQKETQEKSTNAPSDSSENSNNVNDEAIQKADEQIQIINQKYQILLEKRKLLEDKRREYADLARTIEDANYVGDNKNFTVSKKGEAAQQLRDWSKFYGETVREQKELQKELNKKDTTTERRSAIENRMQELNRDKEYQWYGFYQAHKEAERLGVNQLTLNAHTPEKYGKQEDAFTEENVKKYAEKLLNQLKEAQNKKQEIQKILQDYEKEIKELEQIVQRREKLQDELDKTIEQDEEKEKTQSKKQKKTSKRGSKTKKQPSITPASDAVDEETQPNIEPVSSPPVEDDKNKIKKSPSNKSALDTKQYKELIGVLNNIYKLFTEIQVVIGKIDDGSDVPNMINQITELKTALEGINQNQLNLPSTDIFQGLVGAIDNIITKLNELKNSLDTIDIGKQLGGQLGELRKNIESARQVLDNLQKANIQLQKEQAKIGGSPKAFEERAAILKRMEEKEVQQAKDKQIAKEDTSLKKQYSRYEADYKNLYNAKDIDAYNVALQRLLETEEKIRANRDKAILTYGTEEEKNAYNQHGGKSSDVLKGGITDKFTASAEQQEQTLRKVEDFRTNYINRMQSDAEKYAQAISEMSIVPDSERSNWTDEQRKQYDEYVASVERAKKTLAEFQKQIANMKSGNFDFRDKEAMGNFMDLKNNIPNYIQNAQTQNKDFVDANASNVNETVKELDALQTKLEKIQNGSKKLIYIDDNLKNTLQEVATTLNTIKQYKNDLEKNPLKILDQNYSKGLKDQLDVWKNEDKTASGSIAKMQDTFDTAKAGSDRVATYYTQYATAVNNLFKALNQGTKASTALIETRLNTVQEYANRLSNVTGLSQDKLLSGDLSVNAPKKAVDAQAKARNDYNAIIEQNRISIEKDVEGIESRLSKIVQNFSQNGFADLFKQFTAGSDVAGFNDFVKNTQIIEDRLNRLKDIQTNAQKNDQYLFDKKNALEYIQVLKDIKDLTESLNKDADKYQIVDNKLINGQKAKWETFLRDNPKLSGAEVESIRNGIAQLQEGINKVDYTNIVNGLDQIALKAEQAGHIGSTFLSDLTNRFKNLGAYLLSFVSFYRVIGVFKDGINIIHELDDALTEMQKVSDESLKSLKEYQKTTFATANEIGTTAAQLQQSTADWLRLGEDLQNASQSAQTANVLFNVSEFESINEATTALVAMSAAYADAEKNIDKMDIVDRLNLIGNNYAIATDELATALQDGAATLQTAGNDLDEAIALTTAGNLITQNASKTGKGVRTIALRLTGTKEAAEELEEMGEDTSDMIMSQSKMRELIMNATKVASNDYQGFDIQDELGRYKSTYEIMLGLAQIWDEIQQADFKTGDNRQNLLLESIAGKNRASIAASILQNPETLQSVYEDSSTKAAGSAMEENQKYLDSISGHLAKLQNAWQEMWANAANRDVINMFIDLGTTILNIINEAGALKSVFTALFAGTIIKGLTQSNSLLVKYVQLLTQSGSLGDAFLRLFDFRGKNGKELFGGAKQIDQMLSNYQRPQSENLQPENVKPVDNTDVINRENAARQALNQTIQEGNAIKQEEATINQQTANNNAETVASKEAETESRTANTEAIVTETTMQTEANVASEENIAIGETQTVQKGEETGAKIASGEASSMEAIQEAEEAVASTENIAVGKAEITEKNTEAGAKIASGEASSMEAASEAMEGAASAGAGAVSGLTGLVTSPMFLAFAVLPALIMYVVHCLNEAKKEQQALIDQGKEATQNWENQKQSLDEYAQKYRDLRAQLENPNLSDQEQLDIKKQIYELQQKITEEYGSAANGIDLVNGKLDDQLAKLKNISVASARQNLTANMDSYREAEKQMTQSRTYQINASQMSDQQVTELFKGIEGDFTPNYNGFIDIETNAGEAEELFQTLYDRLSDIKDTMTDSDWKNSGFEWTYASIQKNIEANNEVLDNYKDTYRTMLEQSLFADSRSEGKETLFNYGEAIEKYNDALLAGDTSKIEEAKQKYDEATEAKNRFLNLTDSDGKQSNLKYESLFNELYDTLDKTSEYSYNLRKQMNSEEGKTAIESAFGAIKENQKAKDKIKNELIDVAQYALDMQRDANDWGVIDNLTPLTGMLPEQVQYGNINLDERQVLKWTEQTRKQFQDAWDSYNEAGWKWGEMPEIGDISTVLGGSHTFQGVEIAFSPILQGEDGKPELLSHDSLTSYLDAVVHSATDEKTGKVNLDEILKIDGDPKRGGKKLIAAVGKAGDEAVIKLANSMHFMGKDGAILGNMGKLAKLAHDVGVPVQTVISSLQQTGTTSGLANMLRDTVVSAEDVHNALMGADDAISQILADLASDFGITMDTPDEQVNAFINELAKMGLIASDSAQTSESSLNHFFESTSAKIEQLSSLTATLQKGQSQTGLTFTKTLDEQGNEVASEVKTIADAYKNLEGFDLGSLFEETATGVKLNYDAYRALAAEEEAEVKRQYKLERAALANQLATATGDKKAEIQKQITELDMLSSAYDGATSALQKYLNQQNASDYGDTYAMLRDTTIKRADELMGKGMVGTEEFRSIAQLFSFESLATTSASENVDAYLAGYEKVKKFFTEDNFTGMKTFADELTTLDEKFGTFTKENINGEDIYKFEASDDQIALLAEHYGVSVDLIESLFDQLKAMGFNIHFYRDGGFEDFEKLDKQIEESQTALKELKKTANDPNLIPDDLFNFNAADLDTPEELKQKIEDLQGIQTKLPVDSDEYKEAQKIIENLQAKLKEFEEHDEYSPKITVEDYDVGFEALDNINNELERMQQLNASGAGETKLTVQDNASTSLEQNADIIAKLPSEVQTTIGMLWATDDPNQIMMQIALINGEEVEIPLSVQQSEAYQQFLEKTNPDQITRVQVQPEVEESKELNELSEDKEVTIDVKEGENEVQEAVEETDGKEIVEKVRYENVNSIQDAANAAGAGQGVNVQTHSEETKNVTVTTDDSQLVSTNNMVNQLTGQSGSTVSISVNVSGMEAVDSAKTNIEELIKKNKSKVVISINGNAALFNKVYTQTNSALNTLAKKTTEPKITANNSNLKDKVSNSKDRLNSIKDKSITITAHQSGFSTISTWKTNTYDKLKDKEIKIKTTYSSSGDKPSPFQGSAHNQGTVISKGRAYAGGTLSGNWGLPKAEKGALINELGSEIIVTPDGHWQIMNSGDPTFVNLPKGSIIFNHKQSESLLKKGYINGSHGKMVGGAFATGTVNDEDFDEDEFEGNAYAIGTTKWNGQLIGMSHATSGGGGFTGANKAKNNSSNKSNKSSNKSNKSSNKNKGKSNKSNSSNKSSKDTLQTLDAIEIRLNRIDALISQLDATAGKTYESFGTRNKALKDDLATVNKEIQAINASLKSADTSRSYLKKAAAAAKEAGLKSGDEGYSAGSEGASGKALSQTWIKKIQNSVNSGQYFTLSDVRNEGLWKKIQAYQTWYEKYVKLQQKVQEQTAKLSQLTIQQLSLIQSKWEATLNTISANITTYQNRIDLLAEQGYNASEDYYTNQILENQKKVNALTSEASDLQKKLDEAVKTGRIKQYSEEWFKWYNQIKGIKNEIIATNKEMQTLLNSIRQLRWDRFDHGQERLADLADEMEFLGGLINEIDLFDKDTGIITDKGKAAFGLEAQRYDIYIKQAQKYKEAVKQLNKEINEDFKTNKKYNQTLIEQRDTWLKAQREAIENAHSEKEAIADLVEKGIKKQIEAMEELIDKYEEALDAEKDQQKYADDIAERQKKINSLQKQLRAMEGDDSEEGASRRQKLRDELKEAQKDLQETQEDQRISDIKEALSNMQERYEEVLNARLDNIDALLEEVVSGVNQNGADICETIKGVATSVGYDITGILNNIYTGVQNLNSNVANVANQSEALVSGSTDNGSATNTSAKTLTESTTPTVPTSPTMPSAPQKATAATTNNTTNKSTSSSKNGLIKENGKTYYYKNGKKQTGWQTINGKKYYFSTKDNAMLTGVQKIGSKYYLLDSKTGALKNTYTGLYKQGSNTYYFKSGNIQTGWQNMKEGRRYFSVNSGKMLTGLQKIGGDDYYFNSNGILQTGTFSVKDYTYETDKDGKIKKKTARTGTIAMKTVSNGSSKNISSNIPGIGTIKGKLASGTSSVVRSGMYRVDEEGNEVFINKQGKIYTRLGKGTAVLPHDAAVNLLKGMSDPVNFIASHMDMRPNKNISTTNNTNGDTINNITFEMNGITNYAEFMREAQRDPNFTKYIQEISIGKLNGHNSLKGNSIRFR